MGSMSVMHWAIVLLIILLVFGTKKLTGAGSDLGKAMKNFKDELYGSENKPEKNPTRLVNVAPPEQEQNEKKS